MSGVFVGLFAVVLSQICVADEKLADYDRIIKPTDRDHWAYRPVRQPRIPAVRDMAWPRNPIDRFVLAKLEAKNWQPAADVSRRAWLRRVFLNVIGIPPTLAEQREFLADRSPDAMARVVDDLLSRPAYGERWARHWLDLVRFAETNGYERDAIKPHAWRYRDYVIASLNADTPYDRFVLEQLAGDELPDRSTQTVIATGYYRLGPWDDEPADPKQDRFDQLDDLIRTTSRAFLGLTLGCARCHNHKFDALTMHDYYRMAAIFAPMQRPRNGRKELDLPAGSRQQLRASAARDRRISKLNARIAALHRRVQLDVLNNGKSKLASDVQAAFRASPQKRTPAQQSLARKNARSMRAEMEAALSPIDRQRRTGWRREIERLKRETPDLPRGYFLRESSPTAPKTPLLHRGRAATPGPMVQPGVPTVLAPRQPAFLKPDSHTTRRRLSFAKWLVSPRHPLTARVIVNRVWLWHFGEGLVSTASDFGVIGVAPTHPQLLDWLAHWFVHDANWSLKKLHRLILTSRTYRMSKRATPAMLKADPENAYLLRFPFRRLEVEAIRDSMLAVSGRLNRKMRGASTYLSVPKEALAGHSDPGKIWKPLNEREASRRTVYAFVKRSFVVPMLEVLDLCDTTRSAEKRKVTSVPTQALTMLNGEFANRQARHFAARLRREAGDDSDKQIDLAFHLALCRRPRGVEQKALQLFLRRETAAIQKETAVPPVVARQRALERLCRVVFNLNEFVYPD